MIRSESKSHTAIIDAFATLSLTNAELLLIERYLRGEAEEEALKELPFRNLHEQKTSTSIKTFPAVQYTLFHEKRHEELRKLFEILFQLGEATAAELLNYSTTDLLNLEKFHVAPAKLAAIHAQYMSVGHYVHSAENLRRLAKTANYEPSLLRDAASYCKCAARAKILLLTAYFWQKYPTVTESGTICPIAVEDADAVLLTELEEDILQNMNGIFLDGKEASDSKRVTAVLCAQEAIRKNALSDALLHDLHTHAVLASEQLLYLVGGSCYINYMLSDKLRDVTAACIAVQAQKTLRICFKIDVRKLLPYQMTALQKAFRIRPEDIITWAAEQTYQPYEITFGDYEVFSQYCNSILREQLVQNREDFFKYLDTASANALQRMMEIVRTAEPAIFEELRLTRADAEKEKVIQLLLGSNHSAHTGICRAYLRGEKETAALCAIEYQLCASGGTPKIRLRDTYEALETYQAIFAPDKQFFTRALVYMALCRLAYLLLSFCYDRNTQKIQPQRSFSKEKTIALFRHLNDGGLDIARQLRALSQLASCLSQSSAEADLLRDAAVHVFLQYLREHPEETKDALSQADVFGRTLAMHLYAKDAQSYRAELLSYSADKSKTVRELLTDILAEHSDWRADVLALLNAKKAAQRELAIRVLLRWNTTENLAALEKLLETEKNANLRKVLETVLELEPTNECTDAAAKPRTCEALVLALHKGGKKRSLAWAYETPFSPVHQKNGTPAAEEYLQAILLCYAARLNNPGIDETAQTLAAALEEAELSVYVNELFDKWLAAGAESKKRWVLNAAAIHGGSDIVKKLQHQIQEWSAHSRGAIAANAVYALALSPQPEALLIVDGIARKFKFKQVKTAAGNALQHAAEQLGLTRDELEDKIVPDLGFDAHMERHFDYGTRSFTVTITPSLEIEVFDAAGKKLKNLPAPGKRDDETQAKAAYTAFKEMKKQMKTTVAGQKMRLEQALSAERLWQADAWQALFVKNPIMHQFAIGLIWGIYENHTLTQTFRYMEDGSFNTEDEEEYTLPDNGTIGLVHPIELSEESLAAWKEQLEDYEITQPIPQLERPIYYLTEKEQTQKTLKRFEGVTINSLSLSGKLQQRGWYRGSIGDAGCFYTFYREDACLGLGVELHFSGVSVVDNEDITVYDARFYKAGTIAHGSYVYDEADESKQIPLREIPKRYFSEIVLQLTQATAASQKRIHPD